VRMKAELAHKLYSLVPLENQGMTGKRLNQSVVVLIHFKTPPC